MSVLKEFLGWHYLSVYLFQAPQRASLATLHNCVFITSVWEIPGLRREKRANKQKPRWMYDSEAALFKLKLFSCWPAGFNLSEQFFRRYSERTFRMEKAAENTIYDALPRGRSINQDPLHCSADAYCNPRLQFKGRMMDNITWPCIIIDFHWALSSASLKTLSAGHERSAISSLKRSLEGKNCRSLHVQLSSRQMVRKKKILLCDCQKSKATTGIFFTKPRQRDADQKPGPQSLFFAGSTADWTFSHWKEQSRAGNAKTDERRWRESLYFFFPYLCGLPLLWRDFILHPALCWRCWMSIMESVERGRGWRRETRTLTPMQMDK